MSELFVTMIIYILGIFVTHFCLSRRCFKLTGELPGRGNNEMSRMLVRSDVDVVGFSFFWPLIPFIWFWHASKPFTYYDKLIKMGLEDEEVEEEETGVTRGAYR